MEIATKQSAKIKNNKMAMHKKHYTTTLFLLTLIFCYPVYAQLAVIPKPNSIQYKDSLFRYSKGFDIKIIRGDDATKRIQKQLTDFVKEKKIPIVSFAPTAVTINLQQASATDIPVDGYVLNIQPNSISISSSGNAGLFYGVQTLFQLLNADTLKSLPCLEIKDVPAFAYRGFHLDVVHNFFDTSVIKQLIDAAAKLKLNYFHWQLADEEKWRIEMNSDSTLTAKDNFYTQLQVKEIVKYAQERFITIIPEIMLPAATENLYAQHNKNSIDEICSLFPGAYIYLGNSFTDTLSLNYLLSKNKKIIALDNSAYHNSIQLHYKNSKTAYAAAANGKDVILAPKQFCSFDFYQDWDDEKKSFSMSYLPLDKAYGFQPVGKVKDKNTLAHLIGVQAMLYTPFIPNAEKLFYQAFPRLLAFAECAWTQKQHKNFNEFQKRLKRQKNYFFKEKELPPIDLVRIKPKKTTN